ncbi:unannotated protein [freshwater metagenome]|uniref:Unannotated protein n=1 Tax=freshwater metagenome TaxID=449393 RepID=A0A6J6GWY3_9ZZZZ
MYSRQPITWRRKPSALLSGTLPDLYAFTTASATSPGRSNPLLRYGDNSECARCQLDDNMASSCSPNPGSTLATKKVSRSSAPLRVVAHWPYGSVPHENGEISSMSSVSRSSSAATRGTAHRSCPVFGGGLRFSSSKFQRSPSGWFPTIKMSKRFRCQR